MEPISESGEQQVKPEGPNLERAREVLNDLKKDKKGMMRKEKLQNYYQGRTSKETDWAALKDVDADEYKILSGLNAKLRQKVFELQQHRTADYKDLPEQEREQLEEIKMEARGVIGNFLKDEGVIDSIPEWMEHYKVQDVWNDWNPIPEPFEESNSQSSEPTEPEDSGMETKATGLAGVGGMSDEEIKASRDKLAGLPNAGANGEPTDNNGGEPPKEPPVQDKENDESWECPNCGATNTGSGPCIFCGGAKEATPDPEDKRRRTNMRLGYERARNRYDLTGNPDLLRMWYKKYWDDEDATDDILAEVGAILEADDLKKANLNNATSSEKVGPIELPDNPEELFIEMRRIVSDRLRDAQDFVSVESLLPALGLVELGVHQYKIPEGVDTKIKEKLRKEVAMRVRLYNAKRARESGNPTADDKFWPGLKENWGKYRMSVEDYSVMGSLEKAGSFEIGLIDKGLKWLYQKMESEKALINEGFDDAYRDRIYKEMMRRFNNDDNLDRRDALDLAWSFWQIHEAEARYWKGNPLYKGVNFKTEQTPIIKGFLVGDTLTQNERNPIKRFFNAWDRIDKSLKGIQVTTEYHRGSAEITGLVKDGLAFIVSNNKDGWELIAEGRLFGELANGGFGRSPHEMMVNSAFAGKAAFDVLNKIGELKQDEIKNMGLWYGWAAKFKGLVDRGVLSENEVDKLKLLYAKAMVWRSTPYNPLTPDYYDPGTIRLAYHNVKRSKFLSDESFKEFEQYSKHLWEIMRQKFATEGNQAQKNAAIAENDFKSTKSPLPGK